MNAKKIVMIVLLGSSFLTIFSSLLSGVYLQSKGICKFTVAVAPYPEHLIPACISCNSCSNSADRSICARCLCMHLSISTHWLGYSFCEYHVRLFRL